MKITWFGHSAFRVEMAGEVILIDPFLSGNPTWEGTVEEASKGCTHVVLTHGHDDHIGDTADICKATGATLTSNFEICSHLQDKGVENINPGNSGGTVKCGGVDVTFTVANHSSSSRADGGIVYLGNPHGMILEAKGEPTLYHMGDTNMFSDMALIEEFHKPEIGIVPIGDRFTMGGRQAAIACKRFFNFKTIIPCHYGTFPIIDPDTSIFEKEMGGGNIVVAERGKAFEV